MKRSWLRFVGLLFWVAAVVAATAAIRAPDGDRQSRGSAMGYLVDRGSRIRVIDQSGFLRLRDPVFMKTENQAWIQVGHISAVSPDQPDHLVMLWYDDRIPASQARKAGQFYAHQVTGRLSEVVATMLPAAKREKIRERMEQAFRAHGDELMASLVPIVQQSLQRSLPVIEEEFRKSTARHRGEIDELVERWNDKLVDQRLVPLARREVIPIVRRHGQPIAEEIGRELWDRAPLWRFGWRAAYDRSPLPERNLVQEEWERFVDQEAIPVFEQHMDEIVEAIQQTIADIAANQAVTDELGEVAKSMLGDPQAVRILRDVLKESIVDNAQLRIVWRDAWSSDQARQALDVASDRLEPVVREIGDDLFGNEERGINPDFARVLRNQILGKDRRWIVATIDNHGHESVGERGEPIPIRASAESMPYPVVYLADRRHLSGDDQ
jgi:hypothetical protein